MKEAAVILAVSILIQLVAAYIALTLIRITGRLKAWLLISSALVVMCVRQSITLYRLSTGLMPEPPDLSAECATLLISALMLAGIKGISPVFLLVKSMADRLRESETLFRSLADTTSAAIVIYKGNHFQYVNHAAQHICGCSTEDILGMSCCDMVHPEHKEQLKQQGFAALEGISTPKRHEFKIITKAGTERWIDLAATTIEFAGLPSTLATAIDVTERKLAEVTLRESEIKYRQLVENANSVILNMNMRGEITFLNTFAQDFFGYTEREIHGRSALGTIIPEVDSAGRDMRAFFKDLLRFRHRYRHSENENMRKSGERVLISWANRILSDEKGIPSQFLCIGNDVTQVRSLEEQVRQSQKLEVVGRLAGGIAHDFNNILGVITGYSELALMDMPSEDPHRENIETVRQAAKRAASLTRQLLAFSRKQVLEPAVLNLNFIIQQLEKMLRRLIGEDIDLATTLDPRLAPVKVDPSQIEQVILNLAVNARDAMPRGGKLTIETANVDLDESYTAKHVGAIPGPHVMLAVSDTGMGMNENVLTHIFEPFFTTKEQGVGTGLGLATVYGIVKQSGGNIWVYSEEGRGTTFKIYIPRHKSEAALHDRVPFTEDSTVVPGGSETILLVEDDETLRSSVTQVLKKYGYSTLEATSSDDAIRISETNMGTIHLLLTDVVMPGMSGRELAERLTRQRPEIRILFMSGYTDDAIIHHGVLESGMAFIQKPFTIENLMKKIRRVMEKRP